MCWIGNGVAHQGHQTFTRFDQMNKIKKLHLGTIKSSLRQQQQQQLEQDTAQLVQLLSTHTKNISTKPIITSQRCYKLFEGWMQFAKHTKDPSAATQCLSLLELLSAFSNTNSLLDLPNRHLYDLTLQALVATNQLSVAHEVILKTPTNMLSSKSFHIVMNGWAKQIEYQSGSKAQELWNRLESLSSQSSKTINHLERLELNPTSLSCLVEAWGCSGHPKAHDQIWNLFSNSFQNQPDRVDRVVVHSVLKALPNLISSNKRRAAETCEHVLLNLLPSSTIQPTTQTYSLVIHAWAQCEAHERQGRAALRAEQLLESMMTQYLNEGSNLKPNVWTFTTCMAAWARCQKPHRAERLLDQLLRIHKTTQDDDLQPDTAAGNAVLVAWSKFNHPQALFHSQEMFLKLQTFAKLDLVSYNAMLHAYSTNKQVQKAIQFLEEFKSKHKGKPDMLPDVVSYNCILNALAKSDKIPDGQQAESILDQMERLAIHRPNVKPTCASYTCVIQAHSNHPSNSPSQAIRRIYQRALDASIMPDSLFFVTALRGLAKEQVQPKIAWDILASDISKRALSHNKNNDILPVTILETCQQLLQHPSCQKVNYLSLLTQTMDYAKEHGVISRRLLGALRKCSWAIGKEDVLSLVLGQANTQNMPRQWSSKIPARHRPSIFSQRFPSNNFR
jgi:pentatricopeptide repeat protein